MARVCCGCTQPELIEEQLRQQMQAEQEEKSRLGSTLAELVRQVEVLLDGDSASSGTGTGGRALGSSLVEHAAVQKPHAGVLDSEREHGECQCEGRRNDGEVLGCNDARYSGDMWLCLQLKPRNLLHECSYAT